MSRAGEQLGKYDTQNRILCADVYGPPRASNWALLALEVLAQRSRLNFTWIFFGQSDPCADGFLILQQIMVFAARTIGRALFRSRYWAVFSLTNLLDRPQEMMACRLPVLELDVESTRAVYPADCCRLAPQSPVRSPAATRGFAE